MYAIFGGPRLLDVGFRIVANMFSVCIELLDIGKGHSESGQLMPKILHRIRESTPAALHRISVGAWHKGLETSDRLRIHPRFLIDGLREEFANCTESLGAHQIRAPDNDVPRAQSLHETMLESYLNGTRARI